MIKTIILVAAGMLAGCAMPQGAMKRTDGGLFGGLARPAQETQPFVEETLEVVTAPPGARVQVNDAFVGYAPAKALVRRYWNGAPGGMVLDQVKIEAIPVAGGQCVQGGMFGEASRKVPSPVRFNMSSCAEGQSAYTLPQSSGKK